MWMEKREFGTSVGTFAVRGCSYSAAAAADYVAAVGSQRSSGTGGLRRQLACLVGKESQVGVAKEVKE